MNRGVRVLLVLLVAIAMAGIASYAVYQGIQRIPAREVEVASQPVVVAAKALPVGALIGPGDVKLAAWPSKSMVAGAFAAIDDVAGRGLLAAVLENEPVTTAKLAPREAGAGLAPTIPLGMRAVSVRVNDVIGVAGFVVPGSRVDVVSPSTRATRRSPARWSATSRCWRPARASTRRKPRTASPFPRPW